VQVVRERGVGVYTAEVTLVAMTYISQYSTQPVAIGLASPARQECQGGGTMLISSARRGRRGNIVSKILSRSDRVRLSVLIASMMAIASLCACGGGGAGNGSGGLNFNDYTAVVVADLNGDARWT